MVTSFDAQEVSFASLKGFETRESCSRIPPWVVVLIPLEILGPVKFEGSNVLNGLQVQKTRNVCLRRLSVNSQGPPPI